MIVLDTSVILKWIFPIEKEREMALAWREKHLSGEEIIAVPYLLFYEVANVLATKTSLDLKMASLGFQEIFAYELEVVSFSEEDFLKSMELVLRYTISVYDAVYLICAEKLGCQFVTADRKLWEKIEKTPFTKLLTRKSV